MVATKPASGPKGWLSRIDGFQQRHAPLGFVYAIQKKYGDDRGGWLAALVAYYGFLSLFPLLLVFVTISSYVLAGDPSLQDRLIKSALGEFPVIGTQLKSHTTLHGSVTALVIGVAGLVWGSQGLSQILIFCMDQVWNVQNTDRPSYLGKLARSLILDVALGLGVAATTAVSSLGSILGLGSGGALVAALPSAVVNIGMFILAFRIVSPKSVPTRHLLAGAVIAGIGWQILLTAGLSLITHQVRHASALYGTMGVVLGFLGFLYLAARISIYAAEFDVVRVTRLWPRGLTKPLTDADRRAAANLAIRETRHKIQTVDVSFDGEGGAPASSHEPAPATSTPAGTHETGTLGSARGPTPP